MERCESKLMVSEIARKEEDVMRFIRHFHRFCHLAWHLTLDMSAKVSAPAGSTIVSLCVLSYLCDSAYSSEVLEAGMATDRYVGPYLLAGTTKRCPSISAASPDSGVTRGRNFVNRATWHFYGGPWLLELLELELLCR